MRHLRPLLYGLDITRVVHELEAHPGLWNQYTLRTGGYAPAHNGVSDIWIRYRSFNDWFEMTRQPDFWSGASVQAQYVAKFVGEEHESVWYPAIDALPSLRALLFDLVRHFEVERLGGVLITRIPPRGEVKAHVDSGWHAGYYEKIAVQLKSAPGQCFCFADGKFDCPPGTVYAFDNSFQHWVENPTEHERITLIVCVRCDQRKAPLHSGNGA